MTKTTKGSGITKLKIIDFRDINHRELAIESIREWPLYPKHHPPESCKKVLTEQIMDPLEKWLAGEMAKGKNYAAMDAGRALLQIAFDMANSFEKNAPVTQELINSLDKKWCEFQLEMGWDESLSVAEHSSLQSEKRQHRKTWKGRSKKQREEIEKKIIDDFKNERQAKKKKGIILSKRTFAKNNEKKYDLGHEAIRKILAK